MNPPFGHFGDLDAMRYHDQRGQMFIGNSLKNFEYIFRIGSVEISGRFIGQQHFRSMHQGARDRRALHLAAAELMHKMVLSFLHSDQV